MLDAPARMLVSLLGGLGALLTQPRALGTAASRGAYRSGHVRCLIKGEVDEKAMFAGNGETSAVSSSAAEIFRT